MQSFDNYLYRTSPLHSRCLIVVSRQQPLQSRRVDRECSERIVYWHVEAIVEQGLVVQVMCPVTSPTNVRRQFK